MYKKIALSLAAAVFFTACSVNDYNLKTPSNLTENVSHSSIYYKDIFEDKNLTYLLDVALLNNEDLLIAAKNLQIANSYLKQAKIDRQPSINAKAGASVSKTFDSSKAQNSENLGLSLSYQLDLFSKLSNAQEVKNLQAQKSTFDLLSAKQLVTYNIAKTYFNIINSNKNIKILENYAKSYEVTLKLREEEYNVGSITKSVFLQTKDQYSKIQTQLKDLIMQRDLYVNALKILVFGLNTSMQINYSDDIYFTYDLPSSIPSEIMTNRPDIAKAILDVKIAHKNAQIAKASFFPSFNIAAGITSGASDFDFATPAASLGIDILQPLFNLSKNKQELNVANLTQDISVLTYEKVVKTALNEVNDAIIKYNNATTKLADYDEIIENEKEIYSLNKTEFDEGGISFLEFLDSERNLQNSLMEQNNLFLAKVLAALDAYNAIGAIKFDNE